MLAVLPTYLDPRRPGAADLKSQVLAAGAQPV
jgi:hypothetical protein